ncbi:MAG TPA: helix-turn-helix domain-containing protein [Streptosporangiaceae bacterium]|nr:helix-turn-helix domain-containing protein [Streptosporangiaceae bacterium]
MGRRQGDLPAGGQQADDPVADFAARLRDLRDQAGSPSFRQLAKVTHYSSSALAEATRGKRLPSEAVLRAFVTGCGAQPDEWLTRLRQAAAASAAAATPAPASGPVWRTLLGDRRRPALVAASACLLFLAGGMLGGMVGHGQDPGVATRPRHAASVKARVSRPVDGVDPIVGGCVPDARLVDKSPVMLDGQQIGALEMLYSAHCGAGWARIYLYPGQQDMLGQVTVKASDGRLASFANPLVKQVSVYTDVITPGRGGCLGADAVFHAPHGTAHATISCQNPRLAAAHS